MHTAKSGPLRSKAGAEPRLTRRQEGLGGGEGGGRSWILRIMQVWGGCRGLIHSSFLDGTRVRAMMMGTRAREPMKRAHRGR